MGRLRGLFTPSSEDQHPSHVYFLVKTGAELKRVLVEPIPKSKALQYEKPTE